jgi:hypothetical protein
MPEDSDDLDGLLKKYAADRKKAAAQIPPLHEVDIRRTIAAAKKDWKQTEASPNRQSSSLIRLWQLFSSKRSAGACAIVLALAFIAVLMVTPEKGAPDVQKFAMLTDSRRGQTEVPAGQREFNLEVNLAGKILTLEFADGTVLTGPIKPEVVETPSTGPLTSYIIGIAGTNQQKQVVQFKGVMGIVPMSNALTKVKAIQVFRGNLSIGALDIPIEASTKDAPQK